MENMKTLTHYFACYSTFLIPQFSLLNEVATNLVLL